jgi:hypothetical protein
MRHALDEGLAAFKRRALLRCPCGKLVSARPRSKIRVGFVLGESRNRTLDANLTVQLRPEECRRGMRIRLD